MESPVRVTLIANTGLLLQYRDTALLLDGIYGEGGHLFSTPSPGTMDKLFQGLPPFEKIDYLLFSHAHSDHFSPALTMEFLRHRRVKGVLLPDAPKVRESGLPEYLRENDVPYFLLTDNLAQTTFPVSADITVQAIKTLHLDKEYWNDLHFCHLISFGAKKVLFTADADYTMESFDFVKDTPLSAVFLNPLFFSALCRSRFFTGSFRAENTCIYHVPFSGDERTSIRQDLARTLQAWPVEKKKPIVLWDELQTIEL